MAKKEKNKMLRIGMLGSNVIRIPPIPADKYVPKGWSGAPEMVVSQITEELVKRGHDVTLFASGDSKTEGKLVSVTDRAMLAVVGKGPHELYEHILVAKAYRMAREGYFDIMHSHVDLRSSYYAPLVDTPTIVTLHSPIEGLHKDVLSHYKRDQYYASISDNQRKPLPDLQYVVTAYNGIELDAVPFFDTKENYLVFAGRMVDAKGPAEAIEVARRVNMPIVLLGSAVDEERNDFWLTKIKPHIDGVRVIHKGLMPREELYRYFGKAKAFIFPLKWEEPFGLVSIETMATGTPTVALRRGSLPEIVEHGTSGFICDTLDEMVEAVKKIDSIDPYACRRRVQEMFTLEKVVDRYETAYYSILEKEAVKRTRK